LERVEQYTRIEQEPKPTIDGMPPAYWPASGNLTVDKLSARYSETGPKVLHDISFEIQSGQHIGVGACAFFMNFLWSLMSL
jgi:ABC-type bacteriocin/lantibiotic exporter with double-glycine peptidase domain